MTEESKKERVGALIERGVRAEQLKAALLHVISRVGIDTFLHTLILRGNDLKLCEAFLPEIEAFFFGDSRDPKDPKPPKVYLKYNNTEFTEAQVRALVSIHERYDVVFNPSRFARGYSLPEGYVAGRVGGFIYVGVSPEGVISS